MKTRTSQINHPSELNSLTIFRPLRKHGRGIITLSPVFDHPQKEQWQADLNRYYFACGCASGAAGLMMMLVLGLAFSIAAYAFNVLPLRQLIVIPIAAAIAGAVIGKIAGLTKAHRRLVRVVHTVQAHWKPRDVESRPILVCG